jgi:hypothetical protein
MCREIESSLGIHMYLVFYKVLGIIRCSKEINFLLFHLHRLRFAEGNHKGKLTQVKLVFNLIFTVEFGCWQFLICDGRYLRTYVRYI